MKVHLFKENGQEIIFGIRYGKSIYVDNDHRLIFSFLNWDLEFEW